MAKSILISAVSKMCTYLTWFENKMKIFLLQKRSFLHYHQQTKYIALCIHLFNPKFFDKQSSISRLQVYELMTNKKKKTYKLCVFSVKARGLPSGPSSSHWTCLVLVISSVWFASYCIGAGVLPCTHPNGTFPNQYNFV